MKKRHEVVIILALILLGIGGILIRTRFGQETPSQESECADIVFYPFKVTSGMSELHTIDAHFDAGEEVALNIDLPFFMANSIVYYYINDRGKQVLMGEGKAYRSFLYVFPENVNGLCVYISKNNYNESAEYVLQIQKLKKVLLLNIISI